MKKRPIGTRVTFSDTRYSLGAMSLSTGKAQGKQGTAGKAGKAEGRQGTVGKAGKAQGKQGTAGKAGKAEGRLGKAGKAGILSLSRLARQSSILPAAAVPMRVFVWMGVCVLVCECVPGMQCTCVCVCARAHARALHRLQRPGFMSLIQPSKSTCAFTDSV